MKRASLAVTTLVLAALCWSGGIAQAVEPQTKGIDWQPDLFAAHKVAAESSKPMLLVFGQRLHIGQLFFTLRQSCPRSLDRIESLTLLVERWRLGGDHFLEGSHLREDDELRR